MQMAAALILGGHPIKYEIKQMLLVHNFLNLCLFLQLGKIAIENLNQLSRYVQPIFYVVLEKRIKHICFEAIDLIILSW